MAVTSIWPISRNPSVVIDYARNPEKTVEKGAEAMAALHKISGVIEYAADEIKTERQIIPDLLSVLFFIHISVHHLLCFEPLLDK